jgi:hypothetical protein
MAVVGWEALLAVLEAASRLPPPLSSPPGPPRTNVQPHAAEEEEAAEAEEEEEEVTLRREEDRVAWGELRLCLAHAYSLRFAVSPRTPSLHHTPVAPEPPLCKAWGAAGPSVPRPVGA